MAKFSTFKDSDGYRQALLEKKDPKKKRIRICMTGCRAHGAKEIKESLEKEIKVAKIDTEIVPTGCQGFCARQHFSSRDGGRGC